MKGPIILDADEVLYNWTGGFTKWMLKRKGIVQVGEITTWNLTDAFPTLSREEIRELVEEFNGHIDFLHLEPIKGAVEGVKRLREAFQDNLFLVVSGYLPVKRAEFAEIHRRLRIKEDFGDTVDGVISLPLGGDKWRVFAANKPGIVIEDNVRYLIEAQITGHQPVAFDQPWNRAYTYPRLLGWDNVDSVIRYVEMNHA